MAVTLEHSLLILPVPNLIQTADYYTNMLGFSVVPYLNSTQPHICLYRDAVEIVLVPSNLKKIKPNRIEHGAGYDGYFTGSGVKALYEEYSAKGIRIVKELGTTDYGNYEFIIEDIDGRWICFGKKQSRS